MFLTPKSELQVLQGDDIMLPSGTIQLPDDTRLLLLGISFIANNLDLNNNSSIRIFIFSKNNNLLHSLAPNSNFFPMTSSVCSFNCNDYLSFSIPGLVRGTLPYPIILKNGYISFDWIPPLMNQSITNIIFYYITI